MKRYRILSILPLLVALLLSCHGSACGQAVRWSPHADWQGRQINLGPTGARGWVQDHRIHIVHISHGSPADGILRPHDTLTGANGRKFAEGSDPRKSLGQAITESETERLGGRLKLQVLRDGRQTEVTVALRVMGEYGATWPTKCEKSAKILREACGYLASKQYPDGHIPGEVGMFTAYSGLLFLATPSCPRDVPEFLDNARRAAHWLSRQDYRAMELNAWPSGYAGLMMAEYYLKTGDRTVLPKLQEVADFISEGQMACGSWAHNMPWGGYGAVNQVGLVCLIALTLADECGLEVDQTVLDRGYEFFGKYADKGGVPYGDHRPWLGTSGNGKNALACVAFGLLDASSKEARLFGGTVADSYEHREVGHTGCYFSLMWGPIAARYAGDDRLQKFVDAQCWYYDLARTHEGGLICQPNPENLGGRTPGSYTWDGPEGTTAGMALFYALPSKSLRILGAKKSESGANQLATAKKTQQQSVTRTLQLIERYAEDGDPYRASQLLAGLQRLLGDDSPQLAEARTLMEFHWPGVKTGRDYYQAWEKLMFYRTLYWTDYGQHAKRQLEELGPTGPKPWAILVATSRLAPQTCRVLRGGNVDADARQPCLRPDFDDSDWEEATGAISHRPPRDAADGPSGVYLRRTFTVEGPNYSRLRLRVLGTKDQTAEVYLNGVLVAELTDGDRKGYVTVDLRPEAAALLRQGENCLAVHCHGDDGKSLSLDVGIEATNY